MKNKKLTNEEIEQIIENNQKKSYITFYIAIICIFLCIPIGIIFGVMIFPNKVNNTVVEVKYSVENILKNNNISINELQVSYEDDVYISYIADLGWEYGTEYIVYNKIDKSFINDLYKDNKYITFFNIINNNIYYFISYIDNNIPKTDIYLINDGTVFIENINGIYERFDSSKNKYIFHSIINHPDIFYWYPSN